MVDVAQLLGPRAAARADVLERYGVEAGDYVLVTAHRPGNVDDPARLARLVDAAARGCREPVVLPLHPRTRGAARGRRPARRALEAAGVRLAPPLGYLDFTRAAARTRARC